MSVAGALRTVLPGEAVFLPRGVPHQLRNDSGKQSRYVILCTPSGFENFVATAGRVSLRGEVPSPPSFLEIEKVKEAAPHFGITLLPPPPK